MTESLLADHKHLHALFEKVVIRIHGIPDLLFLSFFPTHAMDVSTLSVNE